MRELKFNRGTSDEVMGTKPYSSKSTVSVSAPQEKKQGVQNLENISLLNTITPSTIDQDHKSTFETYLTSKKEFEDAEKEYNSFDTTNTNQIDNYNVKSTYINATLKKNNATANYENRINSLAVSPSLSKSMSVFKNDKYENFLKGLYTNEEIGYKSIKDAIELHDIRNQKGKLNREINQEMQNLFLQKPEMLEKYGYTPTEVLDKLKNVSYSYNPSERIKIEETAKMISNFTKNLSKITSQLNDQFGMNISIGKFTEYDKNTGEVIFSPANISALSNLFDNINLVVDAPEFNDNETLRNKSAIKTINKIIGYDEKNSNGVNFYDLKRFISTTKEIINSDLEKEDVRIKKAIEEQDSNQKRRNEEVYALNYNDGKPFTTSTGKYTIDTKNSYSLIKNQMTMNPEKFTITTFDESPVNEIDGSSLSVITLKEKGLIDKIKIENIFNDSQGLGIVFTFPEGEELKNPDKAYIPIQGRMVVTKGSVPLDNRYIIRPDNNNTVKKFTETLSEELLNSLDLPKIKEEVISDIEQQYQNKSIEDRKKTIITNMDILNGVLNKIEDNKETAEIYNTYLKIANYDKTKPFYEVADNLEDLDNLKEGLNKKLDMTSEIVKIGGDTEENLTQYYKISPFIMEGEIKYNLLRSSDMGDWFTEVIEGTNTPMNFGTIEDLAQYVIRNNTLQKIYDKIK